MEPKEKAKELVDKYYSKFHRSGFNHAKQCALIAVDEILKFEQLYLTRLDAKMNRYTEESSVEYWQEVKQEIEKL